MGARIDPTPFEPAMPQIVRAALAEARAGRGPLVHWLNNDEPGWGQVSDCFGLLRGHPEKLDDVVVGWVVGMGMFGDDLHALPGVIKRERVQGPIPAAIDAFAAGLKAGVKTQKRQWKSIETLAGLTKNVPASLVEVLPLGLVSDSALARGVALRLAQKHGKAAREAIRVALEGATGKSQHRLAEALEALQAGTGVEVEGDDGDQDEPQALARGDGEALRSDPHLGQGSDLLHRLLKAWSETRDPKLREPIFRQGQQASRMRKALVAKSKGELEGAWLALAQAKDPGDVDRLLGTPWPGAWKAARERVQALALFPLDPRIAKGLLAAATHYRSFGSDPLHRAIAQRVAEIADPACVEDLERARGGRVGYQGQSYADALEKCSAVQPKRADPSLLAEAAKAGGETKGLDELWSFFWADPTDGQRRLVLADALQAAGDPRGEFITLQCLLAEGGGDAKVRRRAKELLEAHVDAWTGPLPGLERSSRRFERGFLTQAVTNARREELEKSVQANEWRTLEVLDLAPDGDWNALVQRMPCLRVLSVHQPETAEKLAAGAPMAQVRAFGGGEWIPKPGSTAFPNLAVLSGAWPAFRYQHELSRLNALLVQLNECGVPAVVFNAFKVEHLAALLPMWTKVGGPKELRTVTGWTTGFGGEGWRVRVRQGSPRADVAWAFGSKWRAGSLETCLEGLAQAGYREIAVCLGKDQGDLAAHVPALEARGIRLTASDDPIDLAAPPEPACARDPYKDAGDRVI